MKRALAARRLSGLVALVLLLLGCGKYLSAADLPAPAPGPVNFVTDIQPIFQRSCLSCHGEEKQRSGFRLDRGSAALRGGEIGPAIIPGNSAASPLIRMIAGLEEGLQMPPDGDRLTADEIAQLRRWIDDGAVWPTDDHAEVDPRNWWSLRPLVTPAIPDPAGLPDTWRNHPIDRFVFAQLAEAGLAPSAEADRRTLIRRLYFDLIGLPPTPEQVATFVGNSDPLAYEQLIDQLLQSPQYGERWARHWLDLVHYAETHGHDQDRLRENAWPYRDYVIASLNTDKPYAHFVAEQIAADAISPESPELIPALGMLAAGPWDESTLASIREDSIDRQIGRYIDRDDIVTTVMSTFTSTTVHCARCHNHKFDPITQADYYSLQAVFAGTEKADKLYDADPAIFTRRNILQRQHQAIAHRDSAILATLWTETARQEFATWEDQLRATDQLWTSLIPGPVTTASGTVLVSQPDHSLLATGERPLTDTYSISTTLPAGEWTALRLEVLTDDSLPMKGPGRQDNGNFHLNEVRIECSPDGRPENFAAVDIASASADFNQADWDIAKSIDGNAATAWGVHPEEGKPHQAVFEWKVPFTASDESQLRVHLEQSHGRMHTIGKLRLSVTRQPTPISAALVPHELVHVISKPAAERTPEESLTLEMRFWKERIEREIATLPPPQRVFAGTCDFPPDGGHVSIGKPREVKILRRGEISQPVGDAVPGALECVAGLSARFELAHPEEESSRRAALARWMTEPQNPLTWRSIVNRVWHHHFGVGIVDTPNDFGRMGSLPSHPELLDWLAVNFRDSGGSLKQLHRLILTSATYRQTTVHNPAAAAIDGGNRLLWRGHRHRLDAETIRDSLLQLSGRLDPRMGGPSAKQFVIKPGIHVTPDADYTTFNLDDPANSRRSIYRFLFRTLPDPFMDTLDCPAGDQLVPVRTESVTSLQALALLHNPFVIRQCEHLAHRIQTDPQMAERPIDALYQQALQRAPTDEERQRLTSYAQRHSLSNACRVVVNSNEFLFVE